MPLSCRIEGEVGIGPRCGTAQIGIEGGSTFGGVRSPGTNSRRIFVAPTQYVLVAPPAFSKFVGTGRVRTPEARPTRQMRRGGGAPLIGIFASRSGESAWF